MTKQPKHITYEDGSRIALTKDDVPEMTNAFLKTARPLRESFPDLAAYAEKRKAGRPRKEKKKELVTVRLDPDVLAALKANGRGWQTQLNAFLHETYVKNTRPNA